jgi:two-component system, cell cycle sensor histidine kinase and response regulator CckA
MNILVVEDDEMVRHFASVCLQDLGFRTLEAEDGQKGLTLFRAHRNEIDLVLTDVMMPNMDGPHMVQAILGMEPSARILFMSGTPEVASEFASCKNLKLLKKPFSSDRLRQCIHECVAA